MGGSGGGSGGGGGGTGAVSYPTYVENFFTDLSMGYADGTGDTMTMSIVTAMNTAQTGASPFGSAVAFNPDTDITAWEAAITGFDAMLAGISEVVDWTALFAGAETAITISDGAPDITVTGITDAEIITDSAAFGDSLDDQITTTILPRFRAGMLNINAVVSSAYPLGTALIEGFRDRDVAKHESGLRVAAAVKNADVDVAQAGLNLDEAKMNISKDVQVENLRVQATEQLLRFLIQKYSWEESLVRTVVESRRIKIVAKKEEAEVNLDIDQSDASWDLEVFQHGANMLASIGGGTANPRKEKKSQTSSAIGGAMAGAAAGAMAGGAMGAPIFGALAGGILGAAASFS